MVRTVFTVAGVAILLATLWAVRSALLVIYVSALIAMGFAPLVTLLEQPKSPTGRFALPRWLAILAIYLAVLGAFVIVAMLVIPPLVTQADALWAKLPNQFNRLQTTLIDYKLVSSRVTLAEAVQNAPSGASGTAVSTMLIAITRVIGGAFGLITIVILSFYLLIEADKMFAYIVRFVTPGRRAELSTAAREAVVKVSAWLRAQVLLAGVMGTFTAVGLGLMGVPYFFVIAVVAAVGETIPIVGPVIGGTAAVLVAITVSTKLALMVGAYFLVLHQFEANILVPKVMEQRVGVSPVVVMIALLVGSELLGLAGAILAIPTAAIIAVVVEEIALDRERRITP
jgi:predicted PurR-regulated permease PerM